MGFAYTTKQNFNDVGKQKKLQLNYEKLSYGKEERTLFPCFRNLWKGSKVILLFLPSLSISVAPCTWKQDIITANVSFQFYQSVCSSFHSTFSASDENWKRATMFLIQQNLHWDSKTEHWYDAIDFKWALNTETTFSKQLIINEDIHLTLFNLIT